MNEHENERRALTQVLIDEPELLPLQANTLHYLTHGNFGSEVDMSTYRSMSAHATRHEIVNQLINLFLLHWKAETELDELSARCLAFLRLEQTGVVPA